MGRTHPYLKRLVVASGSRRLRSACWLVCLLGLALLGAAPAWLVRANGASDPSTITNLLQLTHTLNSERRVYRDICLEVTVCASSGTNVGVLIAQDATGTELLELGHLHEAILPGEKVRIEGKGCLLRKRDMGVELCVAPVVDNDVIRTGKTLGPRRMGR